MLQTVWIVTEGINPPMKAYSTAQEARAATDPSKPSCMTQLMVDEPIKTWVIRDILEARDIGKFSDSDEAVKYRNNRFQVMDRVQYLPAQHSS